MSKEHKRDSFDQLSFLSPTDAVMVHLLRRFVAEASRIYEVKTGRALSEDLVIRSPADAYEFWRLEMESLDHEQLRTLNLNSKNRIISAPLIYQGTINMTTIRIAEIFRPAIIDNATSLLICHNHPSGDCEPSIEDVDMTKELVRAGNLLGIDVVDHIIIGKGKFVSLKDRRLAFNP